MVRRQVTILVILLVIAGICSIFAYNVERDFGRVDVEQVRIMHPSGAALVGKLYRPVGASPDNKVPAVLGLHGYQNDKDTQGAFAIELSRRGFVVLALDQLGHGDSGGSLSQRGDDATLGGDAAYKYLKNLPFVDGNLGVMGHSMGAGTTLAVGAANPDHKALNPQCGRPGTPDLNNVLLTQAQFEEFRGFRENKGRVEDLDKHPNRIEAFGLTEAAKWDTTYGDFADGSARRQTLVATVHPGVTHSAKAVAEVVDWMRLALKEGRPDSNWIPSDQQIYMWKEWATLLALLVTLFSIVPLTNILLSRPFFSQVAQPMPKRYAAKGGQWWKLAVINILIAGITYPILTAKASLMPSWFRLPMGNGIAVWFLGNILIYLILFAIWYRKQGKEAGVTMYDMGISFDQDKTALDWRILGKTFLLWALLFGWMYLVVSIAQWALGVEFRFLWGFMRQFSPRRFGLFLLYLIPYFLFFLVNGGIFLFGQAKQEEYDTPAKTQVIWWLKNCVAFLAGLAIIWAIQYVPYLFWGMPPGFEALGLPQYGQMWPLMTFIIIPQFIPLLFLLTWFYRKTGKVYLGALVIASIAIWFTAAGSVIS